VHCFGERVLVTRADGVREIVCETCYTRNGIIECIEIANETPCQTEIAPFSWRRIPGAWTRHRVQS